MSEVLAELLRMTRTLGEPERNYVIIGEGNTSMRVSDESFYVKASGNQMETITEAGFVEVRFAPILELLDNPPKTQTELKAIQNAAKVNMDAPGTPSIEVSFHAMLLHECGVKIIGHTHPVAVNRLMCSDKGRDFARYRTFPDEVVLCGPESVWVPYVDPGLELAITMRHHVRNYMNRFKEAPKVILLQNHGLIALGDTPTEILNITKMCVKGAEILAGTYTVGSPIFLSEDIVMHIYKRPDEIYRRNLFL